MLDYWKVKTLMDHTPQQKELDALLLLSAIKKQDDIVTPSPDKYDQYDATLTHNSVDWWIENKLRFIPERWIINGTKRVPPGLLVDLSKVEYMYSTGRGWIIQYIVEQEAAYIVKVGNPDSYAKDNGMYPKNSYDGTLVEKTVCFIPVKDAERRIIDINGILFNAKRV